MLHRKVARRAVVVAALLPCLAASAEVKLHRLFNDDMILQRAVDTTLFGTADVGERVTVTAAGKEASTTADATGRWVVKLDTTAAPKDAFEVVVQGTNRRTLRNVLAGDVYLCSGQSNMQMTLSQTERGKEEAATVNFPQIRQFDVPPLSSETPVAELSGWGWSTCTTERAGGFYAVPYYFAKKIHADVGVPVGLVCSKWSGSVIAAWIRKGAIEAEPAMAPALKRYAAALDVFPAEKPKYDAAQAEWLKNGKKGDAPRAPLGPGHHNAPGGLYNGMIAPLMPLKIKGVLWYQGEQNVWEGGAPEYRGALPALITDWRKQWGQGDIPFLIVQLPNFGPRVTEPTRSRWAELREAQASALSLLNTAMAVTIDVGEADNVHPKNKKDVGERLALAALSTIYGKAIESHGPRFERVAFNASVASVHLSNAAGLSCKSGSAPTGFTIAGEDKRFHAAEASIGPDGLVTLSNASVPRPIAVRYAWADTPDCNLVNAAGLPAQPFRSDDWTD